MTIIIKPVCPKCGKVVGHPERAIKHCITDKVANYYHISCAHRVKWLWKKVMSGEAGVER